MKNLLNVSLQTKIMGLIVSLVIGIIFVSLSFFTYYEINQSVENSTRIGLQTAKTVANMNSVEEALTMLNQNEELQHLAIRISSQVDANFIIIENRDGKILAHPIEDKINSYNKIHENFKAIVFGGYYSLVSEQNVGLSIVGKAPIFNDQKQVIGVVTVGYLKDEIITATINRVKDISIFVIFIILIGVISSILLARNIRKDTLDLEPREIATLYRDRNAILSSINEGIIAMDNSKRITLMNQAAQNILGLDSTYENKPIYDAIQTPKITEIIEKNQTHSSLEIDINGYVVILNIFPIMKEEQNVGTVLTFKDKTEMLKLMNTLSEVQTLSDDLRAQTHEFQNKLYVISGLLQLGHQEEALEMIQNESVIVQQNNNLIFEQIKDLKIQALLFGKIGKASEKKIDFHIEETSTLGVFPKHITTAQSTIIIGNLIDNAFEAVAQCVEKKVVFFAVDYGEEIVLEIVDSGMGISKEDIDLIFDQGYTTKSGSGRGFGLSNVIKVVKELNGSIEVNCEASGTTFTVFIPK
ncbi:ATP-binding protein [Paenisporosarcina antarctica]|uniref:histidine kinase n=1 Tax=Paenisporosarcina antarctica TaxID=417367 RepID=A0A4V1ANG8_9BACL|nr:sensor histidine kinase [Paenisporosarcina antarctica]QBP42725.1 sensor histidine kinase [Paenisporosarcina antarctica]